MTDFGIPAKVAGRIKDMGYTLPNGEMEPHIRRWWEMYTAEGGFWDYTERDGRRVYKMHRRTVKPAKRVCKEWASLLLNERVVVSTESEACNDYLDALFDRIKFFTRGQGLVEKAFALGTGAWAVWVDEEAGEIQVRRYDARQIVPLSWDDDGVSEVALVAGVVSGGKQYVQLQTHTCEADGYHIRTAMFDEHGNQVAVDGVAEDFRTESADPWFAVVTPAIENTCVDQSPYGMSVYDDAIDVLKSVDIAFDSLIAEDENGKMRVFLSDLMFEVQEEDGKTMAVPFGRDDATIYRKLSSNNDLYEVYAPSLRTDAQTKVYRTALQSMGDQCGFGLNYFDIDDSGGIKTATEVASDNSALMRNIRKHENLLGAALVQVARAVLQAARKMGAALPDEGEVTVNFDDSIVTDTRAEKDQDMREVSAGLMAPWEYRVKWYGEDEATARANVPGAEYEEPLG